MENRCRATTLEVHNGPMTINKDWALAEFDKFLALVLPNGNLPNQFASAFPGGSRGLPPQAQGPAVEAAVVVEKILEQVLPAWKTEVSDMGNLSYQWSQHIEAIRRARVLLVREDELAEKLGDNAPRLNAAHMHPWAWEGARSLWESGHYREAVRAAAVKINAELQNKLGRTDISETDLFNQAFSTDPPKPGNPRLRLMADDKSKNFRSIHRGVAALADGCYAAIRNPISHMVGSLTEDEALEQLAAFSMVARWVDKATVEK